MKALFCAAVLAIGVAGGAVLADHEHGDKKPAEKAPTTKPAPVNKMCPIQSENPVDDRVTIQQDGKTIGFCCEDCIPEFKKNPEKYMDKMK